MDRLVPFFKLNDVILWNVSNSYFLNTIEMYFVFRKVRESL